MVKLYLSAATLLGILSLIPQQSLAQEDEPFLSLGEQRELYSDVLGESRKVIVGLPAGYERSDDTYPVVYLLDGPGHFYHTTGSARFLARSGRMPGVIVVAIPNTDRTRDLTPPVYSDANPVPPTAGGADNFLDFLSGELKPYLEENYRTRPYSILIGHSLGGLLANHALVHRPEIFDAYISISPSLWWDEQRLVAQADSAFDDADGLSGDFYMTMGNEGGPMLGGALKFVGVLEAKAPDSFRWEFNHMDEEDHGSVPHRSTYYEFERIFEGFNLHDPVVLYTAGGLAAIDRHFERVSDRFGYERKPSNRALFEIGTKALEEENGPEAVAIWTRLIETSMTSSHNSLARAHALMGHRDAEIEHYRHTLRNYPSNPRAREKLTEYGVDLAAYPETVEVPTHVLETYLGAYTEADNEFEIKVEGQDLSVEVGGQTYELHPLSSVRFKVAVAPVFYTFNLDDAGSVSSFTIERAAETVQATRVR
jgi:predicted alpha/beta superfamily hydrolase